MSDNVKVAVRVRPFKDNEIKMGCKLIVKMANQTTYLTNPSDASDVKNYTFDYSYWSFEKNDSHFASQQTVFNDLGRFYLDNTFAGYNSTLFAYGQTGSGKVSFEK